MRKIRGFLSTRKGLVAKVEQCLLGTDIFLKNKTCDNISKVEKNKFA